MPTPKRGPLPLLATGGLLLIPLAAFYFVVSRRHPAASGPPPGVYSTPSAGTTPGGNGGPAVKPGVPEARLPAPHVPAPRLEAGNPVQTDFTLAVTHLDARDPGSAALAPPDEPGSPPRRSILYLSGAGEGTGLWIKVKGGLGYQTLSIPEDGRRHVYPFGRYVLEMIPQPHSTWYTSHWLGPNGPVIYEEQHPYRIEFSELPDPVNRPGVLTVTLIPNSLSRRFPIIAQPLSADGKAVGRPVSLLCQSFDATTLFAQIPAAYSAKTQQFRVTVASAGHKAASWRITGLPPAKRNGPDTLPFRTSARVGPYTLRAVAAEAEDSSGATDSGNFRPVRQAGAVLSYSKNQDGHVWTGVPTVRYLLIARADRPNPPDQTWLFQLDRVTPQWSVPLAPPGEGQAAASEQPPDLFPLTGSYRQSQPGGWTLQDGEVGATYPGQQRWLKIEGTALRSSLHTETVTLHNADVVHDAGFGGDRVVWQHPQTVTTPSGITVMVLNGRPGRRETTDSTPEDQSWWYNRGNAELLLAWRLPPGMVPGQSAPRNAPRVAEPPQGMEPSRADSALIAEPLLAAWDNNRPAPYAGAVAAPGGVDARPLASAGYSFLRLSVWAPTVPKRTLVPFPAPMMSPRPGRPPHPMRPFLPARLSKPEVLPPYSWRDGPYIVTAAPLPRHLKTITLQITLREQQEKRPVRLIAPVLTSLPPGADPDAPRPVPVPQPGKGRKNRR